MTDRWRRGYRIVSAERITVELTKLMLAAHPAHGHRPARDTGLAEHVLPELPALRLEIDEHHRHKDVYEHSLIVLARRSPWSRTARTWCCGSPRCCTTSASPAPGRFEPGGGVAFHHHEVVGAKMASKRLAELRYPKDLIADVVPAGRAAPAVPWLRRRRVDRLRGTPLRPRRRAPARPGCTRLPGPTARRATRARPPGWQRAYDGLEERIDELRKQEEMDAIRPEIDGNEIMELLALRPGPLVGKARKFVLDLRMDEGMLGRDRVIAELLRWAEAEGIQPPPAAGA